MFFPIYEQEELAFDLVKSGSWLLLLGLFWGLAIGASAYPHLALFAHKQATVIGCSMVVLGLVLTQTEWIGKLGPWECFGIWLSQVVNWPMWLAQVAASFWGTNKMTKLAAEMAGAPGTDAWKENIVTAAHIGACANVIGWSVVVKALHFPVKSTS